jgi:hypothetical protein
MVRGGFTLPEEKEVSPFRGVLLIALASLLTVSTARSEEHAYITAEASGKASIVDTHSDTVTSTFDAGAVALGMAASVDGARLYVAQQTGHSSATCSRTRPFALPTRRRRFGRARMESCWRP